MSGRGRETQGPRHSTGGTRLIGVAGGPVPSVLPVTVVTAHARRVHDGGGMLCLSGAHVPSRLCRGRRDPTPCMQNSPMSRPNTRNPLSRNTGCGSAGFWLRDIGPI